jgi:hypothetical protein
MIGIRFDADVWIKKNNSTERDRDYREYLDDNPDLIQKIADIYKEDIIQFNYSY